MQEPKHDASRTLFQLERFSFFSDGVFAISITLLIIEIKVPERHLLASLTDQALLHYLSEMSLRFFGFLISFGIVGYYWSVHHRIFGYAIKSTTSLLWINLGFLLTVVLLPFSAGLLGEYGSLGNMYIPYAIYVLNMVLTGVMNCWLWKYVSNPKRKLLTRKIAPSRVKLGVYRSLVIPLMFVISFLIYFLSPVFSRIILLVIPVILHWGMASLEKKADLEETAVVEPVVQSIDTVMPVVPKV